MSFTFDTNRGAQRLREGGLTEAQAEATVDVIAAATSPLVTRDILRAELNHALLVFGLSMAGLVVGVAGVSLAAAALLFN